jgi:hypothetical protein
MIIRPEGDRDDWSLAAVALLALFFFCLLGYALWRADQIDAAGPSGGRPQTNIEQPSRLSR